MDDNKAIKYFKISYKRLVVTYMINKQNPNSATFVKTYTLRDILQNPNNWFVPPDARPQTTVQNNTIQSAVTQQDTNVTQSTNTQHDTNTTQSTAQQQSYSAALNQITTSY